METTMPNLEIPEKMREFADRTVEQARKLSEGYFSVARQASDRLNGASIPAPEGAGELVRKCIEYAEQNANAGFDHAARLVRANDIAEAMKMQVEFIQGQFAALQKQAQEIGPSTAGSMADAGAKRKK